MALIVLKIFVFSKKRPCTSLAKPRLFTSPFSVSLTNIKIPVDITDPYPPIVGGNSHQALSDVTDLVVIVQKLDVSFDGCLWIFGPCGGKDFSIAGWG